MRLRLFSALAAVLASTLVLSGQTSRDRSSVRGRAAFSVVETTIPELRIAMDRRRTTSRAIVTEYLTRIGTYEDLLHAALVVSRTALADADLRDRERAAGRSRGALHGVPVALKDNIHTTTLPTTGGALVFDRYVPPYEATLVANLRAAGAIIIAKTGMTELANWVAGPPRAMPGNYNTLGGFGFNPYDPRRDPRPATFDGRPALPTGGSSSGVGTAANLWAASVGTETSGSILSPANQNMLAAIKPTVGRISRRGVIPITADQDTPGPMARWVTDAAILLGVLEGGRPDPDDSATTRCAPPAKGDYTRFLKAGALKGARIGIPRAFFYERFLLLPGALAESAATPGFVPPTGGLQPEQSAVMADAIAVLQRQGAVIVDPADIPSVVDPDPKRSFLLWPICSGAGDTRAGDGGCSIVLKYGMKRDFNKWLESLGGTAPVRSLSELRAWNAAHEGAAIKYGQSLLDISDEMDVERDRPRYEADRRRDLYLTAEHGIDEIMDRERLDALLFPGASGAALAARPGYPTVIVPFGTVANDPTPPFPDGFAARAQPLGVSFTGRACSEPTLIGLAFAFEQATRRRQPPAGAP